MPGRQAEHLVAAQQDGLSRVVVLRVRVEIGSASVSGSPYNAAIVIM